MAIAFDAAASLAGSGTPASTLNWNHTCTGSNLILIVAFENGNIPTKVTGVTYNTVAMTHIGSATESTSSSSTDVWYLIAPATGTNQVSVTTSTTVVQGWGMSASYTGAKQSGQPDASTINSNVAAATAINISTTTVADNCWVVITGRAADGDLSGGTNATARIQLAPNPTTGLIGLFDTNAPKTPAGSITQTINDTLSRASEWVTVSIAPAAAAGVTTHYLPLLGIGS